MPSTLSVTCFNSLKSVIKMLASLIILAFAWPCMGSSTKSWLSKVFDVKSDCGTSPDQGKVSFEGPIYEVLDSCGDKDAVWDYEFKSLGGKAKNKAKAINWFQEGRGILKHKSDRVGSSHSNFKMALKTKTCLKFNLPGLSAISGLFDGKGQLQGDATMTLENGNTIRSMVKDSRISPNSVLREFTPDGQLIRASYARNGFSIRINR